MIFSHFFNLPSDYMQGSLTNFLSFNEVVRLFIADRKLTIQLAMLTTLLEKGETTAEIDTVTAFLVRFIQKRQHSPVDFLKQLAPTLHKSLQSSNTTLAHQLAGKFLLSDQKSLPYSEVLSNSLQVMLEAMPTDPDLANVVFLLFLAGDTRLQEDVLQKLQAVSSPADAFAKKQSLLNTLSVFSIEKNSPSAQAPDHKVLAVNKFWDVSSTGRITNQADKAAADLLWENNHSHLPPPIKEKLGKIWNNVSKGMRQTVADTLLERLNTLLEQLNNRDAKAYHWDVAVSLGYIVSNNDLSLFSSKNTEGGVKQLLSRLGVDPVITQVFVVIGQILSSAVELPEEIRKNGVDALIRQLNRDDVLSATEAAGALGQILSAAVELPEEMRKNGVDALIRQLNGANARVGGRAAAALGQILSAAVELHKDIREEVVTRLLALLNDNRTATTRPLAVTLGKILSAAVELPEGMRENGVNTLIKRLYDHMVFSAAPLGQILSAAVELPEEMRKNGVDALIKQLNGANAHVGGRAAAALGQILSAAVELPEEMRKNGVDALIRQLNNTVLFVSTQAAPALQQILNADVTLSEYVRNTTIIALFEAANKQCEFFYNGQRALVDTLDAILDEIKNPPAKPRWSENEKATIVMELLKTKNEISEPYLQKFIYWDKGMRALISAEVPKASEKTKKLNAIIGIIEACESAPAQVLQITNPSEVDEELPRASFKP